MSLIIDGHNLIGVMPDIDLADPDDEWQLVQRLRGYASAKNTALTVVFDPRVSRGILGHLTGAIRGAAVARKSTFLQHSMGKQIANEGITIVDDPKIVRGQASRPFDGEGVSGERLTMVDKGVLNHWYLSTSIARGLGLETNGRGARRRP